MTTALEPDLQTRYTAEERDAMFEAYADACGTGDYATAREMLKYMPVHPRWAKIIANVVGREFLVNHFNITHADEVYGEGWLDGK